MDPVSAVSTASATITFFQFTYGFLRTAYEIYDSGNVGGYEKLEDVAKDTNTVSGQVVNQSPSNSSEDEAALFNLAKQCHQLSTDLVRQIGNRKMGEKRIQFAIKGAFKLVCTKDVIIRLQGDLERCQAQFHLRLTMIRSEKIQNSLIKLQEASEDFQKQLGNGRERANQRNIIEFLRFDMIDERYQDVQKAAETTFEWIVNDPRAQTFSNSKLQYSFRDWLLRGHGIFHISGKPGSGKSTLMKFLVTHSETEAALKTWARDKKLIVARYFFWKAGKPLQRTFRGLIRSMLCSVLEQCLEVIPQVLPAYWDPYEYEIWNSPPVIEIGDDEIIAAFDRLIRTTSIYKDHSFCFFIDGLDEFEDLSQTHDDLVSSLHEWVKTSPDSLKICASSREWPAFLNRLPDSQRIRLQDLTKHDIETVVGRELRKEEHFQKLLTADPSRCQRLEQEIVHNTQGVFLWVTLTLRVLRQGLENLETLRDLNKKLKEIPLELEDFYSYILNSILRADRRKALFALAFTVEASKDNTVSNESIYPSFTLFRTTSLFRYSFLSQYAERENFAGELKFCDLTSEQIQERMKVATIQIYGHCKGLLEVRDEHGSSGSLAFSSKPSKVAITHTSIIEFLENYLHRHLQELQGFDYAEACIQTFIAVVKSVEFDETHVLDQGMFHLFECLISLIRDCQVPDKIPYFRQLALLDDALSCRQASLAPGLEQIRWVKFSVMGATTGSSRPLFSTILHAAIYERLDEYGIWKIENSPELLDSELGALLLEAVIDGIFYYQRDLTKLLRELLGMGLSSNSICVTPDYGGLTIWELHATRLLFEIEAPYSWHAAQIFLEFGAPAPAWELPPLENTDSPIILKFGRTCVPSKDTSLSWGERLLFKRSELGEVGRQTLFSVMRKSKPDNTEEISRLLEKSKSYFKEEELPSSAGALNEDIKHSWLGLRDMMILSIGRLDNYFLSGFLSKWARDSRPSKRNDSGPMEQEASEQQKNNNINALQFIMQTLTNSVTAWFITLCALLFAIFYQK